uniref:Uncharacterized protein n=1 Tax=Anguilla anguilla TaxID=7936 RepID=A0A0E9XTP8_ANGAN
MYYVTIPCISIIIYFITYFISIYSLYNQYISFLEG